MNTYYTDLQAAEQLENNSVCVLDSGSIRKMRKDDKIERLKLVYVSNAMKVVGGNEFIEKDEYVRYRIVN